MAEKEVKMAAKKNEKVAEKAKNSEEKPKLFSHPRWSGGIWGGPDNKKVTCKDCIYRLKDKDPANYNCEIYKGNNLKPNAVVWDGAQCAYKVSDKEKSRMDKAAKQKGNLNPQELAEKAGWALAFLVAKGEEKEIYELIDEQALCLDGDYAHKPASSGQIPMYLVLEGGVSQFVSKFELNCAGTEKVKYNYHKFYHGKRQMLTELFAAEHDKVIVNGVVTTP